MATELINGEDGEFNEWALDSIRSGDASISVVAIMGPQSSGKSTLLNQLFGTNFKMMNAEFGRGPTTKGIWIAKAPLMEPVTMVLDLEGTDGRERGEDDKTFEKQSTLFALTVADTVLVNMWGHEIGREHAASRPLLRTIFKAMLSLTQGTSPEKTTLMFVVRDKPPQTPPERLELKLNKDVHEIWQAVRKPKGHEHTAFTQNFNMKITMLSNYEFRRDDFDREVFQLKSEIVWSLQTRDNNYHPTLSVFLSSAKKTWDMIKVNKDFQVPPYRALVARARCDQIVSDKLRLLQSDQIDQALVARARCDEIVSDKLRLLQSDEDWLDLQQNAKTHLVNNFGKKTSSILNFYLSKYDEESMNLEENVTKDKRQYLISEALKVVHPAYMHTLGHIRSKALQSFKTQLKKSGIHLSESAVSECRNSCVLQFTQQCSDATTKQANWHDDVSTARQELLHEISQHQQRVEVATMQCEEIVSRELRLLQSNQAWLELQQNAKTHLVKDFGEKTSLMLDASLSKYDEESMNLEENVTKDKRQFLMSEALKVVHSAYMNTLGHLRCEALQTFTTQLEENGINFSADAVRKCRDSCVLQFTQQCSDYATIKQANWEDDVSTVRLELLREIKEHTLYQLQEQLSTSLTTEMEMSKVMEHPYKVWGRIRSVIKSESERAESAAVDIFGVEKEEVGRIVADLKRHAENRVETYFKDKSRDVATFMQNRFIFALMDSESATVKEEAYRQCLVILSTMAVIRLDKKYADVRRLLHSGLIDGDKISTDSLSSMTWKKVPLQKTLITPVGCRDIWHKFKLDMELYLTTDKLYRKMQRERKKKRWSLPTWAIVGLLCLGCATFVGLAICFPLAAEPLIAAAMTLAAKAIRLIGS